MNWTTCLLLEIDHLCPNRIASMNPLSCALWSYIYCQVLWLATASSNYQPLSRYRPSDTYIPRFMSESITWAGNLWPAFPTHLLVDYWNNKFIGLLLSIGGVRLTKHGSECIIVILSKTLKFRNLRDYCIFRLVERSVASRLKYQALSLKMNHLLLTFWFHHLMNQFVTCANLQPDRKVSKFNFSSELASSTDFWVSELTFCTPLSSSQLVLTHD